MTSFTTWVGICICGKRAYLTKRDARQATRRIRGRRGRLAAYRCDHDDRYWHVGHQPVLVTRGEVPRGQWVSKPRGDR